LESIYVIKAFAAEAEQNSSIDQAEIESLVASYRARLLMRRQLDFEVAAELDGIDWNALAREDYAANKVNYGTPEKVRAAHILISSSSGSEKEVETTVNTVLERLAEGEDFGTLAVEYSDDPGSAAKRGDLGFFTRGEMVKPFADTAFALVEPGEISVPVKTKFGWHIIRLTERRPSRQRGFEKVKPRIISQLKKDLKGSIRADRIADVKSGRVNLGIEVNLPLLNEYVLRYTAGGETDSKQ
jgi:peptidyl-prolyl cis-trans isomerase C